MERERSLVLALRQLSTSSSDGEIQQQVSSESSEETSHSDVIEATPLSNDRSSQEPIFDESKHPNIELEFEKHNIACLSLIVELIQAPYFQFAYHCPWDLQRKLQKLIGNSNNCAELTDIAYLWRRDAPPTAYLTNSSYHDPRVWGFYLDLLPINVVLPEKVRRVLNRSYNQSFNLGEQTPRRTYRLLHPLLKKDFLTRVVWKHPFYESPGGKNFSFDELEQMGWQPGCHPSWLLSPFWFCRTKLKQTELHQRISTLSPGVFANTVCTATGLQGPLLDQALCKTLRNLASEMHGIWPLIKMQNCAFVFFHQEMRMMRTTYFIFCLGIPGPVARQVSGKLVKEGHMEIWKRCFIEQPSPEDN